MARERLASSNCGLADGMTQARSLQDRSGRQRVGLAAAREGSRFAGRCGFRYRVAAVVRGSAIGVPYDQNRRLDRFGRNSSRGSHRMTSDAGLTDHRFSGGELRSLSWGRRSTPLPADTGF